MNKKNQRLASYLIITIALIRTSTLLKSFPWVGNAKLHMVMQTAATLLAFMIGISSLVRFYSKSSRSILFIGMSFFTTAFLDGIDMDLKYTRKIFEIFQRLHGKTEYRRERNWSFNFKTNHRTPWW